MSVLIRGMNLPKNCDECPCYYETEGAWRNECEVLGKEYIASENRPEWCPLIELPPHGRLIDAWEFEVVGYKGTHDGYKDTFDDGVLWMCEKIDEAPTIIPADKDGDENV